MWQRYVQDMRDRRSLEQDFDTRPLSIGDEEGEGCMDQHALP